MMSVNKPLTVQGQLALELYRYLFNFVESVIFDSTLDEIEENYFELQQEVESRIIFLSPELKSRVEKALDEIAVPLLSEETFSAEYVPEIGHSTPNGFHVDNLALLVRTHEQIMAPYKSMLHSLAKDILSLL